MAGNGRGQASARNLAAMMAARLEAQDRALEELRLLCARMEVTLRHFGENVKTLCAEIVQMRGEQRAQDLGIAGLETRARLWGGIFGALLGAAAALTARLLGGG